MGVEVSGDVLRLPASCREQGARIGELRRERLRAHVARAARAHRVSELELVRGPMRALDFVGGRTVMSDLYLGDVRIGGRPTGDRARGQISRSVLDAARRTPRTLWTLGAGDLHIAPFATASLASGALDRAEIALLCDLLAARVGSQPDARATVRRGRDARIYLEDMDPAELENLRTLICDLELTRCLAAGDTLTVTAAGVQIDVHQQLRARLAAPRGDGLPADASG